MNSATKVLYDARMLGTDMLAIAAAVVIVGGIVFSRLRRKKRPDCCK